MVVVRSAGPPAKASRSIDCLLLPATVANTGFSEKILGAGGIGLDLSSKARHQDAEIVWLDGVSGPPNLADEVAVGEYLSHVLDHGDEELVLRRRQLDLAVTLMHQMGIEVDGDVTKLKLRVWHRMGSIRSTKKNSQSREEFRNREGLGEIVVRPPSRASIF